MSRKFDTGLMVPRAVVVGHALTGAPFFVLNNAYGVSGAQPAGTFLAALRQAHPDTTSTAG